MLSPKVLTDGVPKVPKGCSEGFCHFWHPVTLEHLAMVLGCTPSWEDERLLRRPQEEDRRGCGERDAQGRGRRDLRRWYLLGQALRRRSQGWPVSSPEEAPRLQTQAGRDSKEALGGRPRGAPGGHLPQRREFLRQVAGVRVSDSTVSRMLKRMGWSRKKTGGCDRTRRVPESGLAGYGRRYYGSGPLRVR